MEPTGSSDDKAPVVDAATSSAATSNHDDASSPVFDLTSLPLTPPREQSPEGTTQQDGSGSDSSLVGDNGSPHLPPALVMDCDDVISEGDEGGEKSHGSDVVSNPGSNTERQLALRISDSSVDSLEEETKPVEPDDAIPTPITAEDQKSELVTSRVDSPSSDCGPMNGQPAVERVVAEQETSATNGQLTSSTNGQLTRTSQENSNARKHRPQSLTDGILADDDFEENVASYKVKQVAKMKRFFTTLQGFGNKMSGEVAEQVQELITALVVRFLPSFIVFL